jgi:hypothetical protein
MSGTVLAANRPVAKKGDTMVADTWRANPKLFEAKAIKTAVISLDPPGFVSSDAPVAAVRILTGNQKDEVGGKIIVLMPLEEFQEFVGNFSQREIGSRRDGSLLGASFPVMNGIYVTIQGEGAALYQLKPELVQKLNKPSKILADQIDLEKQSESTEKK